MRKFYSLLGLVLCLGNFAFGNNPNLVQNPGFEERRDPNFCPSNYYSVINPFPATSWAVSHSADYYHTCATNNLFNPNQLAQPVRNGGNAYAGIVAYDQQHGSSYQEYLIQTLKEQRLSAGKQYYVEFWVSLKDGSNFSVSTLGMWLVGINQTMPNLHDGNAMRIQQAQIRANSFINNRSGWTKVSGYVTPSTDIDRFVIGNFNQNLSSETVRPEPGGCGSVNTGDCSNSVYSAYYYIDDVIIREECRTYGYLQKSIYGLREDGAYWDPNVNVCPGETIRLNVESFTGATYYRWDVDGWGTLVSGQGTNMIEFKVPSVPFYGGVISLYVTNSCGVESSVVNAHTSFYTGDCSGGVDWFAVYPNPAVNSITIDLDKESRNKASQHVEVRLYDSQGTIKRVVRSDQSKLTIDTSDLPKGIYYLHASDGKRTERKQINIER